MDQVPPGVFITEVSVLLSKEELTQLLMSYIGFESGLYHDGIPAISENQNHPGHPTKSIRVSGIRLSSQEILRTLFHWQTGLMIFGLKDVDFNLPRKRNNLYNPANKTIHDNLRTALGFRTLFNFIRPDVINNELGNWTVLRPYLYMNDFAENCNFQVVCPGEVGLLGWRRVMSLENKRNYYQDIENGIIRPPDEDLLWLQFDSVLHAVQFVFKYNRHPLFNPSRLPFITVKEGVKVKGLRVNDVYLPMRLTNNRNIGADNTLLDFYDVEKRNGFVPFQVLNPEIIYWNKIRGFKTCCKRCHTPFRLVGIDMHCVNLFSHCNCKNKDSSLKVTKLTINRRLENMTMGDTEVNYNMDEGLYPVLPGVKINFQSLGELAEHVGQCSSYETEHVNWKYFENQTHGKLLDLSPLPHSSNSTLFKYTALVQVEKSCFWSKKESTKIGYLTLILNPNRDKAGQVSRVCGKYETRLKSQINDVIEKEGNCLFRLQFRVSESQLELIKDQILSTIVLVPHPRANDAVWKALSYRSVYEMQEENRFPSTNATLQNLFVLQCAGYYRSEMVLDDKKLATWLGLIAPISYVGFDIKLKVYDKGSLCELNTTGRIVGAKMSVIDTIVVLPSTTEYSNCSAQLSFYVIHPQPLLELFCQAQDFYKNITNGWAEVYRSSVFQDFPEYTIRSPNGLNGNVPENGRIQLEPDYGALTTEKIVYYSRVSERISQSDFLDCEDLEKIASSWNARPNVQARPIDLLINTSRPIPTSPIDKVLKRDPFLSLLINDILKNCTLQQLQALDTGESNYFHLVEGPPKSGKTTTMIKEVLIRFCTTKGMSVIASPSEDTCEMLLERMLQQKSELNVPLRIVRMRDSVWESLIGTADGSSHDLHVLVARHPSWTRDEKISRILQRIFADGLETITCEESKQVLEHKKKVENIILGETDALIASCKTLADGRIQALQKWGTEKPIRISGLFLYQDSRVTLSNVIPLLILQPSHVAIYGDQHRRKDFPVCLASEDAQLNISLITLIKLNPALENFGQITNLNVQFGMSGRMTRILNHCYYDSNILSHTGVIDKPLQNAYRFHHLATEFPETNKFKVILHDYSGLNAEKGTDHMSLYNPKEVRIVIEILKKLITSGQDMAKVAVISLYEKQRLEIGQMIKGLGEPIMNLGVNSVVTHPIEIGIVSFVRSNRGGEIGELSDPDLFTYPLSRSSFYTMIVCNSRTFIKCGQKLIQSLFRDFQNSEIVFRRNWKNI